MFNTAILGYQDMTFSCHGPLCAFIDLNPGRFKLMLMPRDHLKTSCISIGANLQKVVKNVNERILLGNESSTNAERFLGSIKQHAEGNVVFRALYSSIIPKDTRKVRWNNSELDFNRDVIVPEPTFDAIGMTGAVVSRHYTHICYDDPISEEAVKSEKVMQDTITRMSGALSLLVNPEADSIWVVGTRWALYDTYSVWMDTFGEKLSTFACSALDEFGEPLWPERFSKETLALKRKLLGEYRFSCLMMNNPRNAEIQDLNVDDLRFWEWSADGTRIRMFDKNGVVFREHFIDELDITCTVDPASAEKAKDDRNAICTVGVTPYNEAIVLDAWGKRCSPLEVIDYLFEMKRKFAPRVFGIEDVGYQKTLKVYVTYFAEQKGLYLNIQPLPAKGKKEFRIRAIQPYMATGRVYINAAMHLLRNEMADFPLGKHDDVLESLSMHTMLWRGQMSPEARTKYKEHEDKLTRAVLRSQGVVGQIRPQQDFDPDEVPDEFDRPQRRITEVLIG